MNSIINYVDKYSLQLTFLLAGVILIIGITFLWLWFYNRKKYHHLKHQIPAHVVKNYLDSIIQNSTSLKSSLFRGGGLDVDVSSVPSVMPLTDLPGGSQVGVEDADVRSLKAKIASLEVALDEKKKIVTELEDKNAHLEGEVKAKQEKIEELEALLAKMKGEAAENTGPDRQGEIDALNTEIDKLKEQLQEYDIISADIANMKKLQEENEQLKNALDNQKATPEPAPVVEEVVAEEPAPVEEPVEKPVVAEEVPEEKPTEEPAEEVVAQEEAPVEEEEVEEKSPEDLLSEFEKMLG